jgi:anhydro-N-acetylmuramic acid kinase
VIRSAGFDEIATVTLFIGLMSGTSLDAVDAALVDFGQSPGPAARLLAHVQLALAPDLRQLMRSLNTSGADELHRAALASNALALAYADAIEKLLAAAAVSREQIVAIGAHGQTVRHRPGEFDGLGYTLQLLNGALLAERCGIDVVCDLRSRDVAAGGQGAPLVPAFHAAVFGRPGRATAVLNLGGIANLTLIAADGRVSGFDCGPGNALLDLWCERHRHQAFDDDGAWAASGCSDPGLLSSLLAEPFVKRSPPKSTGLDLFNAAWIDEQIARAGGAALPSVDIQATLAEFSAQCAANAVGRYLPAATELLVCGGGAMNGDLMRRLRAALPGLAVKSSAEAGLPPQQVEAAAFAWLAKAFCDRQPGNRVDVTGAAGPRVLGALYPA